MLSIFYICVGSEFYHESEQNSNSYAAGLLIASNIDDLGKPEYKVPGYQYPLKKSYFGVDE